ncbi:MAG TPA: gamma-glutamylcyclotransferase family protein [Stellaceae bacterium]|nr:gamma-glutamylcyclotransferase family protein [Stellaceae bacterium]
MSAERRRYFAYGANIIRSEMAERCPAARELGVVTLPGWRFAIGAAGYGTILRDPKAAVVGVLWSLTPGCEATLDEFEAVAGRDLYRKDVLEVGGEPAMVYVASDPRPGRPQAGYLESIVKAAEELGFPADYVANSLRPWLRTTPRT